MNYRLHTVPYRLICICFAAAAVLALAAVVLVLTAPVGNGARALELGYRMLERSLVSLLLAVIGGFVFDMVLNRENMDKT